MPPLFPNSLSLELGTPGRLLTATYPGIRILFTSGYTDDAITQHGVLEPGVEFLPKPYTAEILARKVREMLDAE